MHEPIETRRPGAHRIPEVGRRAGAPAGADSVPSIGAAAVRRRAAALGVAALFATGVAAAAPTPSIGIVKVTITVGNLISPLSTRGVEEALKRLPGVATVQADRVTGVVVVTAAEKHSLDLGQIRERAARAGFPPQGEPQLEARGRFEIGREGKITFRPGGTGAGWQVLESARLLALFRGQPRLQGDYLIGFRLHEKPPWNRPAISLTDGTLVTPPRAAPVVRAASGK